MGLPKNPTTGAGKQSGCGGKRRRVARRPRKRRCLLKGCGQHYHPARARQRYCSKDCQAAARKWARWKAQQRYRASEEGKQKRKGQNKRYRERVRSRNCAPQEPLSEAARVIPKKISEDYFRGLLRPAWLLRGIPARAAQSPATLLLCGLPPCPGARPAAGTALERRLS